ncbi:MAG TPA: bifunctional 5,10-methylenetetrahydrofolate dehydrogenase/5,10-methenyltetrahydrofolate cyclohydrolase [Candidatus Limnocylindria bacterium]|nr:bifunctional 5,10-methylenetetrahydrofolate dehydrogenase/5,10-methenyltetrahydrofolate cyclohydrolase [Candidatus Limnocylindria bacterium]
MSARLLDGRALAAELRDDLRQRVDRLASGAGGAPRLAILGDGASEAASLYAASLDRAASRVGIPTELRLGGDEPIEEAIERHNADPTVAGIVIAQPFANPAAGRRLVEHVDPAKDVDGATPTNAGWLARGEPAFVPATALAVIALLEAYEVPIAGRRTVIVGRSAVVGRPVASLLLARDATVVICHRATRDLARETRQAELLVVAAGVPRLIGADVVSPAATVVDCGINAVDGGIVGDVDTAAVAAVVEAISPVPGGVGPVTPMMVLRQTVEAAERASRSSA